MLCSFHTISLRRHGRWDFWMYIFHRNMVGSFLRSCELIYYLVLSTHCFWSSSSFLACNSKIAYVDSILHRGWFWAKSAAAGSIMWWCLRSCCMVLSHIMFFTMFLVVCAYFLTSSQKMFRCLHCRNETCRMYWKWLLDHATTVWDIFVSALDTAHSFSSSQSKFHCLEAYSLLHCCTPPP